MARPTKQGIDYFPLDCSFNGDIELLIAEFGAEGLGIIIMIWQRIYRDKGNYVDAGDDLYLMLKRESLSSMETVKSCVEKALSRGIFSLSLYEKYGVLTSRGVQRRYFEAAKQKKVASIRLELLLIDVSMYGNAVIIDGNSVIIDENATKVKEEVNVNVNVKVKEKTVDAELIYQLYPKKVDKGHAIKAINAALKKVDANVLLESVKRYAAQWDGKDKQFCPNPATWFNGERWDDEPEIKPNTNGKQYEQRDANGLTRHERTDLQYQITAAVCREREERKRNGVSRPPAGDEGQNLSGRTEPHLLGGASPPEG